MIHEPRAKIEEVVSVLAAAPGVSIDQALGDAALQGYDSIQVDRENNTATIRWFKRQE